MKYYDIIFLITVILLFTNCDTDTYLGYRNEAQDLINTTTITGQVIHFYEDTPVFNAKVKIGLLETLTDLKGMYKIDYILSEDVNRNKFIPISISKEDFFSFEDSALITPSAMQRDFRLQYAAPIIHDIAFRNHPSDNMTVICQAVVTDYQGIMTIDSVLAVLSFTNASAEVKSFTVNMNRVGTESVIKGYYQVNIEEAYNLKPYCSVLAKDYDGYSASLFHSTRPAFPDTWLFDPGL